MLPDHQSGTCTGQQQAAVLCCPQPCIIHLTRRTNRLDFSLKGLYNSYMKAGIELAFYTGEQIRIKDVAQRQKISGTGHLVTAGLVYGIEMEA